MTSSARAGLTYWIVANNLCEPVVTLSRALPSAALSLLLQLNKRCLMTMV